MHSQYIAAIFASFALTGVLADPIAMPAAEVEAAAGAQVLEARSEQGEQGAQASQGYYGRYPYRRRRNRNRYNRRRRYNRYDDDYPNYNQCEYGIDCDSRGQSPSSCPPPLFPVSSVWNFSKLIQSEL